MKIPTRVHSHLPMAKVLLPHKIQDFCHSRLHVGTRTYTIIVLDCFDSVVGRDAWFHFLDFSDFTSSSSVCGGGGGCEPFGGQKYLEGIVHCLWDSHRVLNCGI